MKVIFQPTNQTSPFSLHSPPWDWIRDIPIPLTRNKVYEVLDSHNDSYKIINDNGFQEWYNDYHFESLDEIREKKIDTLLD